jgi:hypothetical protein
MTSTPLEIDEIVRRVLTRLTDLGAHAGQQATLTASSGAMRFEQSVLTEALVSQGIQPNTTISVRKAAVITPAAWDVLRRNNVNVVRENQSTGNAANHPVNTSTNVAPMFVVGKAVWLNALHKRFCPKQVRVDIADQDDSANLGHAIKSLRGGSHRGILLAEFPHATNWQAARNDAIRSAVVSSWAELPEVLGEVPVNLIILNRARWNAASTANVIRAWQKSVGRS